MKRGIFALLLFSSFVLSIASGMPVLEPSTNPATIDEATLIHWLEGWYSAFTRDLDTAHQEELAPFAQLTPLEVQEMTAYLKTGIFPLSAIQRDKFLEFDSGTRIQNTVRYHKIFLRELYRRREFELLRSLAVANPLEAFHLERAIQEAAAVYVTWMYEDTRGWSFLWAMRSLAISSSPKVRFAVIRALSRVGSDRGSLDLLLNLAADYSALMTPVTSTQVVSYGGAIRNFALHAYQSHQLAQDIFIEMFGTPGISEPAISCEEILAR